MISLYNRYIPQPDGSYRRNRIPDNRQPPPPVPKPMPEAPCVPDPPSNHHCKQHRPSLQRKPHSCPPSRTETSAAGFLRKILPKDFDTGDLMIVLLLLLMAGDCTEDQNTALLTLALYFFM